MSFSVVPHISISNAEKPPNSEDKTDCVFYIDTEENSLQSKSTECIIFILNYRLFQTIIGYYFVSKIHTHCAINYWNLGKRQKYVQSNVEFRFKGIVSSYS